MVIVLRVRACDRGEPFRFPVEGRRGNSLFHKPTDVHLRSGRVISIVRFFRFVLWDRSQRPVQHPCDFEKVENARMAKFNPITSTRRNVKVKHAMRFFFSVFL
jgi:hypothetical protein